jgi:hypothetical protein
VRIQAGPEGSVEAAFERRAARAEMLAGGSAPAEEPLRFAAGLYRAQARLASALERAHSEQPFSGRLRDDASRLLENTDEVIRYAARSGPPVLSEQAEARGGDDRPVACARLLAWWEGGRSSGEDYLSRALLRPYVEFLASRRIAPDRAHRPGHCPVCGGAPWIAARRAEADGDGARRSLGCALCGGDWSINRIRCPCCAEEDPARLPSFQSDAHPTAASRPARPAAATSSRSTSPWTRARCRRSTISYRSAWTCGRRARVHAHRAGLAGL